MDRFLDCGAKKEVSHAGHKLHNAFTFNESIRESLIFEVEMPYFQLRDWMRTIKKQDRQRLTLETPCLH